MSNLELLQLTPPVFVALLLLCLLAWFFDQYLRPSYGTEKELKDLANEIYNLKKVAPDCLGDNLIKVFDGRSESLQHAWNEYGKTLHSQYEDDGGEQRISCIRSTVPAGYFFASQNIVDTPLKTEYFKHLPGIMTGIGIIGTFAGLLIGLSFFDASNPDKVQESVSLLLKGVRDAFLRQEGQFFALCSSLILRSPF